MQLVTSKDDPVHGDVGKRSHFDLRDGRKFEVRYNEADASFPIVSIGEALQQGSWFVFGPGCQMMLPGSRPSAAKLEKHRTFWCGTVVPRTPWRPCLAIEAPPVSVPDLDATPVQLDETEEAGKPKHKALSHNVIKEVYDAHQLTHLPFRSWCDHCVEGKAVDDAHRPRIDPHKGESQDWV